MMKVKKKKSFKFYAVEVNYPEKIKTGESFGFFSFGTNYTMMDRWDIVAVFSKKKFADKHIALKEYFFPDDARGARVIEWELDDRDITKVKGKTKIGNWKVDLWV